MPPTLSHAANARFSSSKSWSSSLPNTVYTRASTAQVGGGVSEVIQLHTLVAGDVAELKDEHAQVTDGCQQADLLRRAGPILAYLRRQPVPESPIRPAPAVDLCLARPPRPGIRRASRRRRGRRGLRGGPWRSLPCPAPSRRCLLPGHTPPAGPARRFPAR